MCAGSVSAIINLITYFSHFLIIWWECEKFSWKFQNISWVYQKLFRKYPEKIRNSYIPIRISNFLMTLGEHEKSSWLIYLLSSITILLYYLVVTITKLVIRYIWTISKPIYFKLTCEIRKDNLRFGIYFVQCHEKLQ